MPFTEVARADVPVPQPIARYTSKLEAENACRDHKHEGGRSGDCGRRKDPDPGSAYPGSKFFAWTLHDSDPRIQSRFFFTDDQSCGGTGRDWNGDGQCDDGVTARNLGTSDACVVETDGDPIHVATGNNHVTETDLPAAGPAGLEWVRYYNSAATEPGDAAGFPGGGWTHTYSRRVRPPVNRSDLDPDAPLPTYREFFTAALHRPDGQRLHFHRREATESAPFLPDPTLVDRGLVAVGTNRFPFERTESGWRYRTPAGEVEHYDAQGRLERIVDRNGFTRFLEYDAEGGLVRVRDGFGRSIEIARNAEGAISSVTGPDGGVIEYSYDESGRLSRVRYPDGTAREYRYEAGASLPFELTGIIDENGEREASWEYDERGRAAASEHAGGTLRTEFEYLPDGTTRVTNPSGAVTTYSLTLNAGDIDVTALAGDACSSCGEAAEYEYNELGLPVRETDRNGNVTTYRYDEHGLEVSRTEAAGTAVARTITTEWDTELRLPLAVNEPGRRTEYSYDRRGRRLSMTGIDTATGASRRTTWSYHPDSDGMPGQLAAIDGPRTDVADVTRFDYDAQGNRIRVTNALGHVTAITDHDAWGRPLRLVDPNGLVTQLAYDARGRLLSRDVGGEVTTFAYDAAGNLITISLPDGSALHYEYDAAQRLVAIADEESNRIEYTLDAAGNRIAQDVHDATGTLVRTQQQVFDRFDRLIRVIGAAGQTTTHVYDDNGNRTGTTDPIGDATQQAFDALDRLTTVTDPMGGIIRYTYDAHDRVTSVTDPNGNTTSYDYDGLGNRIRRDSPDSGITTYEYDAAGNVTAKTDARGQRTDYAYDALNRLIHTEYADGATVDYIWDEGVNGIGRLARIDETRADGWSSTIAWSYDPHGRVLERRQAADGVTLTTQHAYDAAGRRIETVYPSGRVVTYTHDHDALTGIAVDGETVLEHADYEPFGPVSGWTWGDGDVHSRRYDLDGRLVEHGLAAGSEGGGTRTIDYYPDDNIAAINGPNLNRTYGYDGLDRLVSANDPDLTDSYGYDPNGNRLSRTVNGETETYTIEPGSNRLLGISGAREVSYSYDANGSLVDDGEHTYTYSARNRLIEVDGGDTAVYRYNALGQRIFKRAGSEVDYAALAEEYRQKAEELAAEVAALQEQAQQKRAEADAAANEAQTLLDEAETLRTEADQHEQHAATLEEEATRLRGEAETLRDKGSQKEAEAQPLQEEADRLLAEARRLRAEADAEWQAAEEDQRRADALAASARQRLERAATLEQEAAENDRIAVENRARLPELEAEAEQLRIRADHKEAEAQPYLEQVERLERRIAPLQRSVDRFTARLERLRERLIENPRGWRDYWRNVRIHFRIEMWEWVRGWLQWRVDTWRAEQAGYQAAADALLAEAAELRAEAARKDEFAIELAEEANRLEAEAVELRAEAERERILVKQEQDESAEYARKGETHRGAAKDLDYQAQLKEDEARRLVKQASTLQADAESLRAEADTKAATANAKEQEADDFTQRATDKRSDAAGKEQQAETLNAEATRLYDDADILQGRADGKQAEADAARKQADEYAERAEHPTVASEGQFFVYDQDGRLIGRYDESGDAIREYYRTVATPVAITVDDALYFIHTDHLDTARSASVFDGDIIWSWISKPYGDTAPQENADHGSANLTVNLRFPGQYFDRESNRHYNLRRTYDPSLGRYITSDPIGVTGDEIYPTRQIMDRTRPERPTHATPNFVNHVYGYSSQNPTNISDPTGEIGIFGAVFGAGVEVALQLAKYGGRIECLDFADIAISAAVGAIGPGVFSSASKLAKLSKIASRNPGTGIGKRAAERFGDEFATQAGFQAAKEAGKAAFDCGCDECECKR